MSAADTHAAHEHDDSHLLQHHFEDMGQQKESVLMGMWAFLAQEVMFFGGLIGAYTVYRFNHPIWHEASRHLNLPLGFFNTLVLLCSSLTMATSVHYAVKRDQKRLLFWLICTFVLGITFLGVKVVEYTDKYNHHLIPGVNFATPAGISPEDAGPYQLFYVMYFLMTGMHALHMIIGIGILAVYLVMAKKGMFTKGWYMPVEIFGFYWHFVDIVWVYLFPLLYLIDRSTKH